MNVWEWYFKWVRSLSKAIVRRLPGQKPKVVEPDAPTLGRYRDEVLNTPLNEQRIPEPRFFTKSAEYYAQMLHAAVSLYDNSPCKGDAALIYACYVHADWGLIYSGAAAIPYALEMLKSSVPEAREAGAGILAALGKDDAVVEALLASLATETDTTARDTLILALGQLRNRKAISALAAIIKDPTADGDTRHTAAESLGRIVRRRFLNESDPVAAAIQWLDDHS